MKSNDRLELENNTKIHYVLLGGNFRKVRDKLEKNLKYHRLVFNGKFKGVEVIYDVPSNLLSNAGLVLSKQLDREGYFFKVRKISTLPGGFKKPAQKFTLGESEEAEAPKDFPMQIANAISNMYGNVFTIDLVSIVRQTVPKIEISVKGDNYTIVGGTGYRGELLYETAYYKDLATNKKVKRVGVTFIMPKDERYEKENQIIADAIDHYCKELVGNFDTRFEIAQRLLHPETIHIEKSEKEEDEEEEVKTDNKKKK